MYRKRGLFHDNHILRRCKSDMCMHIPKHIFREEILLPDITVNKFYFFWIDIPQINVKSVPTK